MLKSISKKITYMLGMLVTLMVFVNGVYAASATIKASKTTAYVGDSVKITVTVKAAAWNVHVSGSASGSIVGYNPSATNQTTTKTYNLSTKKAGTYKVTISGDVTDASGDTIDVSKTVTVTIKEKPVTDDKDENKTTTTTKSSNANLSKITLNVEGLSFKSSQTTYNIKVGADVDNITVKATTAHSKATYTVSGNKNLKAGNNVIKIVVKAENGNTKTYKINVEKEGDIEESSSALTNLIIENMEFEEAFIKTETEYVGKAIEYTEEPLNVLVYTEAEEATYTITGADKLVVGENKIVVTVTSLDESTTTEYTVTFEMLAKEESNPIVDVNKNENNNTTNKSETSKDSRLLLALKANSMVIIVYILALVEFGQVIYLYVKLEKTKKELEQEKAKNKEQ